MSDILGVEKLKETRLWKRLDGKWEDTQSGDVAQKLKVNLIDICRKASDRMKAVAKLHDQYTLHDETHLIRVTELMARIMPDDVINNVLNPIEIALLILSAYFHDQGMVLDNVELEQLRKSEEFIIFQKTWGIEHPNQREISQCNSDVRLSPDEKKKAQQYLYELDAACLTDYIRAKHGERSKKYIIDNIFTDKRLEIFGVNISSHLANICNSHVSPVSEIESSRGFRYDESIGCFKINIIYLALVLRLSDLLDFDRERTPDELYRTINFSSGISLIEWEKHRSIEGWIFNESTIRFTAKCKYPDYQRAILRFMDIIDNELSDIHSSLELFPSNFNKYRLSLPRKVDRSRIEPENNAYIYHDLEFTLSRDEIVKLLMTDNLYPPHLCVRELLQNSLDALRLRKALHRLDKNDWNAGRVTFEHSLNSEGREVLRCIDNGVGMDESIIKKYFSKAGRSYYRSPEFEQERMRLSSANTDFDPCSRFGIGFMSCFMLGDRIKIYTRRFKGPMKEPGPSLIVEINGISGLIVIRKGDENQDYGTTVEIIGRKKPIFYDKWIDNIKLIEVLHGYAIATEFPIDAKCEIPEIMNQTQIPPDITKLVTILEEAKATKIITFEQSFSEIDKRLNGSIRTSILIDDNSNITLENSEGKWIQSNYNPKMQLVNSQSDSSKYYTKTCIDGILVCGKPGRDNNSSHMLREVSNQIFTGEDAFILDIRGSIKPTLTPSRFPPRMDLFASEASWYFIQSLVNRAHGKLWEKILRKYSCSENAEILWQLFALHKFFPTKLSASLVWTDLRFPTLNSLPSTDWRLLKDIGSISILKIIVKR